MTGLGLAKGLSVSFLSGMAAADGCAALCVSPCVVCCLSHFPSLLLLLNALIIHPASPELPKPGMFYLLLSSAVGMLIKGKEKQEVLKQQWELDVCLPDLATHPLVPQPNLVLPALFPS